MKCYIPSMKAILSHSLIAIFLLTFTLSVQADEKAERILKGIRLGSTLQHGKLEGHLRKNGKRTPLTLTLKGEDISFQFYNNKKWSGFLMQLKEGNARLFETHQGKVTRFPAKKIGESILNSDVTYEDLSLRFLYWKNPEIIGVEKVKMQKCDKIRLINPGKDGRYAQVIISVHQKYGALMSVAGYDAKGRLLKRFHVTELMTVGKLKTLKKMNVETYKPGTNKVTGISYLEFKKPKKFTRKAL